MRTTILAGVFLLATLGVARADDAINGSFDVKFEEMANNCSPAPVTYKRARVTIETKKKDLGVKFEEGLIPAMSGIPAKNGKINASTKKPVGTTVDGLDAKYSVAGRVDGGMLQLVLVAEYSKHADKKPYCTESWKVDGVRADDKDKKSAEPLRDELLPAFAR
jgi:hypothetical protein